MIVSIVGGQAAFGAQLASVINPGQPASGFEMRYERTVSIHYGDGGQVAELLRGNSWSVEAAGSAPAPDIAALRDAINKKIASDGSATQIDELSIVYTAQFIGREQGATIDYMITLDGTLVGHIMDGEDGAAGKKLVDLGWRGMTLGGPAAIGGVEINLPISAIAAGEPELHSYMAGSAAKRLLNMPLINADGIRNQSIHDWHSRFDPAIFYADAGKHDLNEMKSSYVMTHIMMNENISMAERQVESNTEAEFTADKTYRVEAIQYADSAIISIIGHAVSDKLGGPEIVNVTSWAQNWEYLPRIDPFAAYPGVAIYAIAGIAAVGGGALLVFGNKKSKKKHG